MLEHTKKFEEVFVDAQDQLELGNRAFMPMRKHLAWYCKGFPGAGEMRVKLVQASSRSEVLDILEL